MDIDKQIERTKTAIELSKKRDEIGKEMKIVYNEKISGISCYGDWIDTLSENDFVNISNFVYEILSNKYKDISSEIEKLLTPEKE